jgi:Flp pilus assembly protein TadG
MSVPVFRARDETGAAAVELAVLLPILIVLLFGITDVGWWAWHRVQLQEAAQEGALYGSYYPDQEASIQERVADASDGLLDPDDVDVSHGCDGITRTVTVTVSYDHTPLFSVIPLLGISLTPSDITLSVRGEELTAETC